jgi:hypothetical protein
MRASKPASAETNDARASAHLLAASTAARRRPDAHFCDHKVYSLLTGE